MAAKNVFLHFLAATFLFYRSRVRVGRLLGELAQNGTGLATHFFRRGGYTQFIRDKGGGECIWI